MAENGNEKETLDRTLVGKSPEALSTETATGEVQVRTHNVSTIPESWFWSAHSLSLAAILLAVILIAIAKGPKRIDALKSFQEEQNKADKAKN